MSQSKVERINLYSNILGKEMSMLVYLPKDYSALTPLPILYFLHGRNESENIMFEMEISKKADQLIEIGSIKPMIIACPRLDHSRGINSSLVYQEIIPGHGNANKIIYLGRYEDYFIQEIIPFTEKKFSTTQKKEGRYVGGISSGGYAALHNTFRHQEMFSKVGGHMPALELSLDVEDESYYQEADVWNKYDPIYIAKHNTISSDINVFLDAGDQDEGKFYEGCSILHTVLQEKGIPSQNYIFPGNHNAAYIQANMEKYLRFYGN